MLPICERPHHLTDLILNHVTNFKWSFPSLKGSHTSFISGVIEILKNSADSHIEHPIQYPPDIKIYTLDIGKLDLYAVSNNGREKIALEYDSKWHLRYKSILKLLLSDADTCFAMYGGIEEPSSRNIMLYYDNLRRINFMRKKFHLYDLGKSLHMVNLTTKKSKLIYL
jgi:hypothetical protein